MCTGTSPIEKQIENTFICWDRVTNDQIKAYRVLLSNMVNDLNNESLFKCSTVCNDNYHKNQLKLIYSKIIEVIHTSSDHLKIAKMPKFKKVPGWNQNVKDAHETARHWFHEWVKRGRERNGWVYEYMKIKRNTFHQKLKFCKSMRNEL